MKNYLLKFKNTGLHTGIITAAFCILQFASQAQLPTNNLPPLARAVMTDSNGVIIVPTNLFKANPIAAAQIANNTNLIPPGAIYDNGSSDMGANGACGEPAYAFHGIPGAVYVYLAGVNEDGSCGISYYCTNSSTPGFIYNVGTNNYGDTAPAAFGQQYFIFTNYGIGGMVYISSSSPSVPVTASIALLTNGYFGTHEGVFYGQGQMSLSPGSQVDDSALSQSVLKNYLPLNVYATNGGNPNTLWSSNTANQSTFLLYRAGTNGFADIGFFTSPDLNPFHATLRTGFGVGYPNDTESSGVYSNMYMELYDGGGFNWVTANSFYGGVTGNTFNFCWWYGGSKNTPMVIWDRASRTLSNYVQATFESNVTLHGSAALIAPNANIVTASVNTLKATNGINYASTAQAANYAIATTDNLVLLTASGKTATLPSAASAAGHVFTIKLTASGSGTVATTSSQNIDGAATYALSAQYKFVSVQSDGTQWWIIANN